MKAVLALVIVSFVAATSAASSERELSVDQLLEFFGWDLAAAEIKSQKIAEGFYVLFGVGGNIAVSIGAQGVLVVDDQFPELMPKIEKVIAGLGGVGIDFAINTHWHFDHAQGNLALGPSGTWFVSQANSRQMMESGGLVNLVSVKGRQAPYPRDALPVVTYDDHMQLHFNGERIDLLHTGPAHTTGDTAVIFRGNNAVHMGDVFNNTGYPFIDADNGGDIDGMIAFCRAVVAEVREDAIVIPGHGKVADVPKLERYVDMLQTVRDRVAAMLAEGKSLEQVIAADPTGDFTEGYGDVSASLRFVDRVYTSLSNKR